MLERSISTITTAYQALITRTSVRIGYYLLICLALLLLFAFGQESGAQFIYTNF